MSDVTGLAEQQRTLRDALDVLALRDSPDDDPTEWLAARQTTRDRLSLAHADHDSSQPLDDSPCVDDDGRECAAVELARDIIAGRA